MMLSSAHWLSRSVSLGQKLVAKSGVPPVRLMLVLRATSRIGRFGYTARGIVSDSALSKLLHHSWPRAVVAGRPDSESLENNGQCFHDGDDTIVTLWVTWFDESLLPARNAHLYDAVVKDAGLAKLHMILHDMAFFGVFELHAFRGEEDPIHLAAAGQLLLDVQLQVLDRRTAGGYLQRRAILERKDRWTATERTLPALNEDSHCVRVRE